MLMLVDWMDPKHTDEGTKFAQYCRETLASMHTDDGICKDPAAVCSVSSPDKLWREMLTLLCWCRCQCRLHLQGHGDRYPQCPLLVSSTDWHGKLFFLHHFHLALQQTQAARALRSDAGAFCNVSLACTACMHSGSVADHCVWTQSLAWLGVWEALKILHVCGKRRRNLTLTTCSGTTTSRG